MRFLRVGEAGSEKPAALDTSGIIRDISDLVSNIEGSQFERLAELRADDLDRFPEAEPRNRVGPCVGMVGKFLGIGLNYADHAAESGMPVPEEPLLFTKATSSICGPYDDVIIPPGATMVDWEVELGIVIGKEAKYVPVENAMDHIFGYCVVNDVSERAYQLERGGQFVKGKSADTFGPIGPWLVTKDEISDPQDLTMWLDVDGERVQSGSTNKMIFGVAQIVSHISHFMSFQPGDLITTGTPPGVGMGQKPPRYLQPGQNMALGIDGLGEQRQTAIAYSG